MDSHLLLNTSANLLGNSCTQSQGWGMHKHEGKKNEEGKNEKGGTRLRGTRSRGKQGPATKDRLHTAPASPPTHERPISVVVITWDSDSHNPSSSLGLALLLQRAGRHGRVGWACWNPPQAAAASAQESCDRLRWTKLGCKLAAGCYACFAGKPSHPSAAQRGLWKPQRQVPRPSHCP